MFQKLEKYLKPRDDSETITRLKEELKKVKTTRDRYRKERDDLREAQKVSGVREQIAKRLKGEGIEIGALHNPLAVPKEVTVRYVDLRTREENQKRYEARNPDIHKIVETHYVCDGEKLDVIEDESQDFVIANHMLEHCKDPIRTVENFLRVTRMGGLLYITLPDKRFTYDYKRPETTWEHILHDYETKIEIEPIETYQDWQKYVNPNADAQSKFENQANIHFHAWTMMEMVEMYSRMQRDLNFPIHLESATQRGNECICLLRKEVFEQEHKPNPHEAAAADS